MAPGKKPAGPGAATVKNPVQTRSATRSPHVGVGAEDEILAGAGLGMEAEGGVGGLGCGFGRHVEAVMAAGLDRLKPVDEGLARGLDVGKRQFDTAGDYDVD